MSKAWKAAVFCVLSLASLQLAGVVAQTTDAICLPYFDWLFNSQHQSPCGVGSSLIAVCHGGSFNVESLPSGNHYLGPSSVLNATLCECNTVTYTLMSACAACQGRSYLLWTEWTANCPNVSSGFPQPLPTGLHVPGWAYLDPRPSNTFDIIQAQKNVNLTESVVVPTPTSTSSSVTATKSKLSSQHGASISEDSTTTQVNPASSSSAPNTSLTSSDKHARMIVGITVGAFLAGLAFLSFIVWSIRRRIRQKEDMVQISSPVEVKIPNATNDDSKDSPCVVIDDYDKYSPHRHNL